MNIPSEVIEKLNAEMGMSNGFLENTPYPAWRIQKASPTLEVIREFLAEYELTAYLPYFDTNIVVTPRVPIKVIETLNALLGSVGQMGRHTPCLTWPVYCEPKDLDMELAKVRTVLKDDPVLAYKSNTDWRNDPTFVGYDSISVAPTTNKFDILRFEQVDGINDGLSTEDIVRELIELEKRYKFDVIAGPAVIQLEHPLAGQEAKDFEEWLFDFCSNPFDNTETDLSKGRIGFWWD